ncbi:MAG: hypothetical protein HQ481_03385 [Alphaproteobacteria bacterium]|nr:hypothetical protein [Alphaproteobacteria bacterium]
MRRIMLAFTVVGMLAAPGTAFAQSAAPSESAFSISNPWVVGGAVAGVVAVNAVTGGAMLAPMVG